MDKDEVASTSPMDATPVRDAPMSSLEFGKLLTKLIHHTPDCL